MTLSMLDRIRALVNGSSFLRFLISGGVNTGATYAVYLILLRMLSYRSAYTIAYVFGILLGFAINRLFVFRTHRGWQSVALYPFVYLAQYLVSVAIIWTWVEYLHFSPIFAPLFAIALTIPLTYILSRFVFAHRRES